MPNTTLATTGRQAPWIGIGTSGEWGSSSEALEAAGLDFHVRQEQLFWNHQISPGVVQEEPAPMFGNVRDTDDQLLGCVTPQYRIVQNRDAFGLIDPFLNNGKITHAGMTTDGLVFMVAELAVKGICGEEYAINLMATNSFNTRYPCQIILTPIRIICQNMYRGLVKDRIFLAKHTTAADDRLRRIASSGAVDKTVLAFTEIVENSQSKVMPMQQLQMLIAMLFPYPKEKGPREATFRAKADEQRHKFLEHYYDAPDNRIHHGTSFGFINAYMDWLSHREPARNTGMAWADRRFQGIVSGLDIDNRVIKNAL